MQPAQLKQVTDFLSLYHIHQIAPDITLLRSTHHHLLLKYHRIATNDYEDTIELLDRHLGFDPRYICPLLHFEHAGKQGSEEIVRAVYQAGKVTLREEIDGRRERSERFGEEEIWILLSSVVGSLLYLQERGLVYGVLSSSKIFVEEPIRVLDPSLFNVTPVNTSTLSLRSPQICAQSQAIDFYQSDVYLLALCIIQAATLCHMPPQLAPEQLSDLLEQISSNYSQELMHVLHYMLQESAEERPSFADIREFIEQEIQVREARVSMCPISPPDPQDQTSPLDWLNEENEQEIIDLLEPSNKEQTTNDYQLAKQRYLQESQDSKWQSTTNDTRVRNSLDQHSIEQRSLEQLSLQQLQPIETVDRALKNRNNCEVGAFSLGETVTKAKKQQRVHAIKNRNSQNVKAIQSFSIPSNEYLTSPELMHMLRAETNRSHNNLTELRRCGF